MRKLLLGIWNFYLEGFRGMTLGRTLWALVIVKLLVMFLILKIFFFPDFLGSYPTAKEKGDYVRGELIRRAAARDTIESTHY